MRLSFVAYRIGIPPALNLHDRVKKAVASNCRDNQNHQQPNYYESFHGVLSALPETKKPMRLNTHGVLNRIGLLFNGFPGTAGLPFI
jgi:hypothetical protein